MKIGPGFVEWRRPLALSIAALCCLVGAAVFSLAAFQDGYAFGPQFDRMIRNVGLITGSLVLVAGFFSWRSRAVSNQSLRAQWQRHVGESSLLWRARENRAGKGRACVLGVIAGELVIVPYHGATLTPELLSRQAFRLPKDAIEAIELLPPDTLGEWWRWFLFRSRPIHVLTRADPPRSFSAHGIERAREQFVRELGLEG